MFVLETMGTPDQRFYLFENYTKQIWGGKIKKKKKGKNVHVRDHLFNKNNLTTKHARGLIKTKRAFRIYLISSFNLIQGRIKGVI